MCENVCERVCEKVCKSEEKVYLRMCGKEFIVIVSPKFFSFFVQLRG